MIIMDLFIIRGYIILLFQMIIDLSTPKDLFISCPKKRECKFLIHNDNRIIHSPLEKTGVLIFISQW